MTKSIKIMLWSFLIAALISMLIASIEAEKLYMFIFSFGLLGLSVYKVLNLLDVDLFKNVDFFKKTILKNKIELFKNVFFVIFWLFVFCLFFILTFFIIQNIAEIEEKIAVAIIMFFIMLFALYKIYKDLKKIKEVKKKIKVCKTYNVEDDYLYGKYLYYINKYKTLTDEHIKEIGISKEKADIFLDRMIGEELGVLNSNKKFIINEKEFSYRLKHTMYYTESETKKLEEEKQIREAKIYEHKDVLLRKYDQLTYKDDYGIVKEDRFLSELQYFIKNVLRKDEPFDSYSLYDDTQWVLNIIRNLLENRTNKDISLTPTENPYDFEKQCADILKNNGWNAEATQKSGDMGVDVIATKDNIKIVLQCKLYSKPVGNHAVQEINTGKDYYKADYAGVVSNNSYTTSARQLAKNCGVLLLNLEDLPNLYEKLNKN